MKKIISIVACLVLIVGMLPLVFAEEDGEDISIDIGVEQPEEECEEPVIYKDHTARIWEPNDQTIYTATKYGTQATNKHGVMGYEVPLRQDYAFTGETLKFFLIVEDENGESDIEDVRIRVDGSEVGQCAEVAAFSDLSAFISDAGDTLSAYDADKMKSYVCTVIVQAGWDSLMEIDFVARDGGELICYPDYNIVETSQSDFIYMNPDFELDIDNGPIAFGSVEAGSTALSNTITVENDADGGVVMDMYIASTDYFTDPSNPDAICGDGNGIKYDQFGYYATKGSINSGKNDNAYAGLGETASGLCLANVDEFTPLPSHSGEIFDMCRVINWDEYGSILNAGSAMSVTFQLDVPSNCQGSFTDGQIYFVGRVV